MYEDDHLEAAYEERFEFPDDSDLDLLLELAGEEEEE